MKGCQIPLQKIEKLKGSGYVRKARAAGGQLGFASDNSAGSPLAVSPILERNRNTSS